MPRLIWRRDAGSRQATAHKSRSMWPLYLISVGAVLAVWSGWVELGVMCGFGIEQPLYGIWNGLRINAAISLPLSMEAYGFYAMGFWFDPGEADDVRSYAQWTTILAYCLGFAAQATYHVLAAMHAAHAPIPVVVLVSGVPVATICAAGGLLHKHIEARKVMLALSQAGTGAQPDLVPVAEAQAGEDLPAAPREEPEPLPVLQPDPAPAIVPEEPTEAVPPRSNVVKLPDDESRAALQDELASMAAGDRLEAARSMSVRQFAARFGYTKSTAHLVQRRIIDGTFEGRAASAN
jgi:hypothetical protein